jgi:MFS family permease
MNRNLIQFYIALFTWGIGESMFFIFQPIYLKQWGLSPVMIGTIIGISGFFMIFSQVPAGYLADRFGSSRLIQAIWVIGAVSTWLMAISKVLPLFIIGYMIYYTTACVVPPLNSYVSSMRGNISLERSITMTSVSFNTGAVIGPIIGGILGDLIGLRMIYYIAGTVFIFSNIFVFLIKPDKSHLHAAKKSTVFNPSASGIYHLPGIIPSPASDPQLFAGDKAPLVNIYRPIRLHWQPGQRGFIVCVWLLQRDQRIADRADVYDRLLLDFLKR